MNPDRPQALSLARAGTPKELARQRYVRGWRQRSTETEQVPDAGHDAPALHELLPPPHSANRHQSCDGTAARGDLQRVASLDLSEVLTRALPQLSDADRSHVLHGSTLRRCGTKHSLL